MSYYMQNKHEVPIIIDEEVKQIFREARVSSLTPRADLKASEEALMQPDGLTSTTPMMCARAVDCNIIPEENTSDIPPELTVSAVESKKESSERTAGQKVRIRYKLLSNM